LRGLAFEFFHQRLEKVGQSLSVLRVSSTNLQLGQDLFFVSHLRTSFPPGEIAFPEGVAC
jgi:hypothetical protein